MKLLFTLIALCFIVNSTQAQTPILSQENYGYVLNKSTINVNTLPPNYQLIQLFTPKTPLYPNNKYKITFTISDRHFGYLTNFPSDKFGVQLFVGNNRLSERIPSPEKDTIISTTTILPYFVIGNKPDWENTKFYTYTIQPDKVYTTILVALLDKRYQKKYDVTDFVSTNSLHITLDEQKKKDPNVPQQQNRKMLTKGREIIVTNPNLTVSLYDHSLLDGDIVSIYINDVKIINQLHLTKELQHTSYTLKEGNNIVTMFAENLGDVPPNTATIVLHTPNEQFTQRLSADMKNNEFLTIIYKPNTPTNFIE